MNELYGVRLMKETLVIETLGITRMVDLKWAPGMVGAIPVFDSYDAALEYSDKEELVFRLVQEMQK